MPTFFHNDPFFLIEPWKLHDRRNQLVFYSGTEYVFKTGVPFSQKKFYQHLGFACGNFGIENGRESGIWMIYDNHRLCITMADTAYRMNYGFHITFSENLFECLFSFKSP